MNTLPHGHRAVGSGGGGGFAGKPPTVVKAEASLVEAAEAATRRDGLAGAMGSNTAQNRRNGRLSALRAHTKSPYKMDFHRKKLRNAKGA
jgi:hypothetical protein